MCKLIQIVILLALCVLPELVHAQQNTQSKSQIEQFRDEAEQLFLQSSNRITEMKTLLDKVNKLEINKDNEPVIRKLISKLSTEITKASCDNIPSSLTLLNQNVTLAQNMDQLKTLLDVCSAAYQVVKVEGISSDRENYRKHLEKLKSVAKEFVRVKSYRDAAKDNTLETFKELTLFINDFEDRINEVLEFDPVQLEIPPWSNKLFSFQFYAGVEAISVDDFLQDTSVRLGFQAYHRFSRNIENWRSITDRKCVLEYKCGTWSWIPGFHTYVNASWTSVHNHTFVETRMSEERVDADVTESEDEAEEETIQALVTEFGVFLPIYTRITGDYKTENYHEFMAGPIFNTRFSFTDETSDKISAQYFGGLRLASNEETYLDFLIGKHEGIKGLRGEIRGQHPVTTFAGGRLFLGGRFNVGIDNDKELNEDAWQVYLQWQTSFDDLWQQSK